MWARLTWGVSVLVMGMATARRAEAARTTVEMRMENIVNVEVR